jgi:hypothetical protein
MALQLDFEICQSSTCDTLTFVETTGAYNATSNTTGWGAPNATLASVTSAELTITLASGNSYTIDLLATTFFPTTDNTFELQLKNSDFGYVDGAKIDDQIITFTYTVIADDVTYTQNYKQAFYCQVQCCVLSMFADIDVECDCSKDKIDNALKAYALLKGLIYSGNCGNTTYFNNILAQLQKLCLNNNCASCK